MNNYLETIVGPQINMSQQPEDIEIDQFQALESKLYHSEAS